MLLWTQEEDARLASLLASGLSASKAAKELSRTRNSVIGRAHRKGIKFSGRVFQYNSTETKLKRKGLRVKRQSNWNKTQTYLASFCRRHPAKTYKHISDPVSIHPGQIKSIHDLGRLHCRYIIGDPKSEYATYCGRPTKHERTSYCSDCHARVYKVAQ